MDKMTRAVSYVRPIEGGLVDHPDDPGGITNMGISLRMPLLLVTLMSLILIGMKKSM